MVFSSGLRPSPRINLSANFLNSSVSLDQVPNKSEHTVRLLGFWFNEKLTINDHFLKVASKISRFLFFMRRVRKSLSLEARKLLYFAHIHSHLMYCIPLYILSNQVELDKLLKLQKKALRITYDKPYNYPSSPLFHDIGTIPINHLVEKEIVKLLHNINSYKKPSSLLHFFREKDDNPYYLRQQHFEFHIEFTKSARLSKHPIISFPRIFNNFDVCIRSIAERADFHEAINRHFFYIQNINKCDKKFCKICNFFEWKKRQLSYISVIPKATAYISYRSFLQ